MEKKDLIKERLQEGRSMNKTELAKAYEVTYATFYRWVQPIANKIGLRPGRQTLPPAAVIIIRKFLGDPDTYTSENV